MALVVEWVGTAATQQLVALGAVALLGAVDVLATTWTRRRALRSAGLEVRP